MTKPPIVLYRPSKPSPPVKSPTEQNKFTPVNKPNPLSVAQATLGSRFGERPETLLLDGQPAKLDRVMRETNRVLKAQGLAQVNANPAWVV
ncbi:hypothetical protein J8F10_09060 [Gemmata sp. G18]|uniref:Uncharacterized protein n=1 Tax=Gemmata palustris TaxID=2822762 RepID=A0ABS5BP24_9BACT|nr:hypothetical protein [Gemmata palustris]MBP3955429.1 hypothetical protein [Gemmata palustris]